jgi:N-acetylglucosaminyl-diphospho-decaprenol L-rhamnosyltransferase
MTSRSLLIVNYRSAALTSRAIQSARAASSEPLQVVIVDNSCDSAEAAALQGLGDELVLADRNRGYAGGINLGRISCEGEVLIVSNPDVIFSAAAIDTLVDAVNGDVAVAGPAFFWDDDERWHLPPSDLFSGWQKSSQILAGRSRRWARARDRQRFSQRVAFWSLEDATEVRAMSGAVMAISATAFDTANGFDERFRLYFEETDFLRRLSALRRRILYVPRARCRHLFNQSAGQDGTDAADRYSESEARYLEKWNGPFFARLARRLERAPADAPPLPACEPSATGPLLMVDRPGVVVEVSPLASFVTAAGYFGVPGRVALPEDVWRTWKGGALYLRSVLRKSGEILSVSCAVK